MSQSNFRPASHRIGHVVTFLIWVVLVVGAGRCYAQSPPPADPVKSPQSAQPTPDGKPVVGYAARRLSAIRLSKPPTIDGDVGSDEWKDAAVAETFIDALFDRPVTDQTVVRIGFDTQHIYVGWVCKDSNPNAIAARQLRRGTSLQGDDTVTFWIDAFNVRTFGNRSSFSLNPIGTQFAQLSGGRAAKLEWEGNWRGAAKRTADGWTAEMAIPWAILNYPQRGKGVSGINFSRFQQPTNTRSWWSNIGAQGFLEREGQWDNVEFPRFLPRLSLLPYTVVGNGSNGIRAGLDARAALSPTLTAVGSIRPDFQNVENAVEGVNFSYGERFVDDFRPFFLEGADVYGSGGRAGSYYYSRRIGEFDTGANFYGKVTPRDTIGTLASVDSGKRTDWIVRGKHEFGPLESVDFGLFSREDRDGGSNRTLVLGENFRRGGWNLDVNWANSWDRNRPVGDTLSASLYYYDARFYAEVAPYYIRPGFKNELGFIPFTDFRGASAYVGYGTEWRTGPLRTAGFEIAHDNSRRFAGDVFRRTWYASAEVLTSSDNRFEVEWDLGRYEEFDDSVVTLEWRAGARNPFRNFGASYSRGRRAGDILGFLTLNTTWRFNNRFTTGVSSAILRHTENADQHIVTFNYDFSPRRGLVGRVVTQTRGTNAYVAYRQSGYGGTETFLIVGDPNANNFDTRLSFKTVYAY